MPDITAGTIAAGSVRYPPRVSPDQNVTGATIASTLTLTAPPAVGQVIAGTIAATTALYLPTVIGSLPFIAVTDSVRTSISAPLRLLRRPVRHVNVQVGPAFSNLEPGQTVYYAESSRHLLLPEAEEYVGRTEQLVPLVVLSVTDHVEPARVSLTLLDLREVYCSWWSPLITEVGMTGDLDGIAILDRAGGWETARLQFAYGERPGGDNAYVETGENMALIERYGLRVQGGADINHLLNSTFSEGTGSSFTNWTQTTTGAAIVAEWKLYTLIATPGWQRAVQIATYSSGESTYLSQTVTGAGNTVHRIRVYYKDGGAYDRMSFRVQRSSDSKWWRDSDQTWQSSAVNNPITPATGVINSLLYVSKAMDLTGVTTNLTVHVGHFECASGLPQISQIQGVELQEQPVQTGPYCRYRTPLPTRATAVTRVLDLTWLVNDIAVRVVDPVRGAAKFTMRPHWDHVDLYDGQRKYLWSADYDGASNANFHRCYYTRVNVSSGKWVLRSSDGGTAELAVSGADLATRDQLYTVAARWTSASNDEHGLDGQALDVWVNGVRGTTYQGGTTPTADAACNVYLGGTPNDGILNEGNDASLTHGLFCLNCPTEAELLRM